MTKEESVKCKYCSHFNPHNNMCYIYTSFDQDMYLYTDGCRTSERPTRRTEPNNLCKDFSLTAMDTFGKMTTEKRRDGSYIVSIEDVPSLKRAYGYFTSSVENGKSTNGNREFAMLCAGLFVFFVFLLIVVFS